MFIQNTKRNVNDFQRVFILVTPGSVLALATYFYLFKTMGHRFLNTLDGKREQKSKNFVQFNTKPLHNTYRKNEVVFIGRKRHDVTSAIIRDTNSVVVTSVGLQSCQLQARHTDGYLIINNNYSL